MCTLVILRHLHPEYPLVLAANRDELYARAAADTGLLALAPRVLGGRDLERQGTWMGVNDGGLFVGLTNQRGSAFLDRASRSRGEAVLDALQQTSVEGIERYLDALDAREFLPFNLLYGDARTLRVAYARRESARVHREDVPPGLHVLANDVLDSPALPKVARARELAERAAHLPWPETVRTLHAAMADHTLPERAPEPLPQERDHPAFLAHARELQAVCIHTPAYGTRSSALIALEPGRVAHYLAVNTPPCQGDYRELAPLLYPERRVA